MEQFSPVNIAVFSYATDDFMGKSEMVDRNPWPYPPLITAIQEFLKMMTHKILNRDPKDEILKARSGAVSGCCWLHSRAV